MLSCLQGQAAVTRLPAGRSSCREIGQLRVPVASYSEQTSRANEPQPSLPWIRLQVARLVFQATAEQLACLDSLATSGPAQSARRLHASPAPFNWTDAALLSDLLQASQAAAEEALVLGQLPASGLSNVSLEHAQVWRKGII